LGFGIADWLAAFQSFDHDRFRKYPARQVTVHARSFDDLAAHGGSKQSFNGVFGYA
jgi:hypothetical protein